MSNNLTPAQLAAFNMQARAGGWMGPANTIAVLAEVERLKAALKQIADGLSNEPDVYAQLILDGIL
ncbi:hypothetical protein HOV23_gp105 [Pseudomonas phage Lana]|uniref:Uncharacterized protein n=1 Tax=Pseudomonas phage Lana TaxID=2530172 RepID=A0A481W754_9CAUD|nr:hypothetical protein HOV23_gp105 [Pseudomonas phage Lana]QBJ04468.1 hypothetical protein [Pseudomonas phage Lana]